MIIVVLCYFLKQMVFVVFSKHQREENGASVGVYFQLQLNPELVLQYFWKWEDVCVRVFVCVSVCGIESKQTTVSSYLRGNNQ